MAKYKSKYLFITIAVVVVLTAIAVQFMSPGSGDLLGYAVKSFSKGVQPVADKTPPEISASVNPLFVVVGTSTTISAAATDASGVQGCYLQINKAGGWLVMKKTGDLWTLTYTPKAAGTYRIDVICMDRRNNKASQPLSFEAVKDTSAPQVSISGSVENIPNPSMPNSWVKALKITAFAIDDGYVKSCAYTTSEHPANMWMAMDKSGEGWTATYAGAGIGKIYNVQARCMDNARNYGYSVFLPIAVQKLESNPPIVSDVSMSKQAYDFGNYVTFAVSVEDESQIAICGININSYSYGDNLWKQSDGYWKAEVQIKSENGFVEGANNIWAECTDVEGNRGMSAIALFNATVPQSSI